MRLELFLNNKSDNINLIFLSAIAGISLVVGGTLGIILGVTISLLVSKAFNLAVSISPFIILLASGIFVAVGIIFGFWPAKKTAELDPIEVLRYEYFFIIFYNRFL